MISINITGRLGRDPELKQLESGAVLNLNVAVNDRQKVDGAWTDVVHWFRVTMFGARAAGISGILQKGSRVGVSGKLQPRMYTKDGVEKMSLEIVAWDIEPLGDTKPKDEGASPRTSRPMPNQGARGRPQHRESQYGGAAYGGGGGGGYSPPPAQFGPPDGFDPDDDIPF